MMRSKYFLFMIITTVRMGLKIGKGKEDGEDDADDDNEEEEDDDDDDDEEEDDDDDDLATETLRTLNTFNQPPGNHKSKLS